MIIEKQKEAIVLADGDASESIGMSLDLDSAQILMQMLSKNLYSDAIGSTIRECASNALDSHRRAGTDDPIIVGFKINDKGDYEFSVEDFGIGLDHDDVQNIISKYGKSTKRNSSTELGMMGLGFKAPLAYSSSFYFVCRKDGMERKYMMYEGEDVNTIDLLYEMPTEERNGVKVIVPVKWHDRDTFYRKIEEQLAYFENVFFDVILGTRTINNNFTIYRSKDFQYSQMSRNQFLHLCLDNVYYPLDFGKLDIGTLEFPVALRFSLTDGIYPTPNREAIRYTAEAKEKILEKLTKVADFFVQRYNSDMKTCKNFMDIYDYHTSNKRTVKVIDGVDLNVMHLAVFSHLTIEQPSLDGVKHLNLKKLVDNSDSILKEYGVNYIMNRAKMKEVKATSWDHAPQLSKMKKGNFYIYEDRIPEMKKSYFRNHLPNGWNFNYYFIKKKRTGISLFNNTKSYNEVCYYHLLGLKNIPRQHWREAIIEFQKIVKSITDQWINVDTFVVPDNFVQMHKIKNQRVTKGKLLRYKGEDLAVKAAVNREVYSQDRTCKFESKVWRLKDMRTAKRLTVYGHHDIAVTNLDPLYSIFKKQLDIISLSQREMKILEECEFTNVMSYDEFMKGKSGPFRRAVTAYLCKQLMNEYSDVFRKVGLMESVNKNVSELMLDIKYYADANYIDGNKDLYKVMVDVADQNKLYEHPIHKKYLKLKAFFEDIPNIDVMFDSLSWSYYSTKVNQASTELMVTYMKYHKKRVNLEHYKNSRQVVQNQ